MIKIIAPWNQTMRTQNNELYNNFRQLFVSVFSGGERAAQPGKHSHTHFICFINMNQERSVQREMLEYYICEKKTNTVECERELRSVIYLPDVLCFKKNVFRNIQMACWWTWMDWTRLPFVHRTKQTENKNNNI